MAVSHAHRPDTERTFYSYCLDCTALIQYVAARGRRDHSGFWRVTSSTRARILAGPIWEHPALMTKFWENNPR